MRKRPAEFDWSLVTPFRRRVYEALLLVPRGCVTTYGELGRRVGCCCAQAVGGALRHNPFAPEVPCHRVVAGSGALCGFTGKRNAAALKRKRDLLIAESVKFAADGRVAAECLFRFE